MTRRKKCENVKIYSKTMFKALIICNLLSPPMALMNVLMANFQMTNITHLFFVQSHTQKCLRGEDFYAKNILLQVKSVICFNCWIDGKSHGCHKRSIRPRSVSFVEGLSAYSSLTETPPISHQTDDRSQKLEMFSDLLNSRENEQTKKNETRSIHECTRTF